MVNVEVIAKYDLERSVWQYVPKRTSHGTSLAFASFKEIVKYEYEGTNYIIISDGSKLEDYSKNLKKVKESALHAKTVIDYFKSKNDNYSIKLLFLDGDAPIIEDAKALAYYIDYLAMRHSTKSITIIGQSKTSLLNLYLPTFFRNDETFKKINIINMAAPYLGTKIVSPNIIYPEVKHVIKEKFKDGILSDKIYEEFIKMYKKNISNSHINNDIAVENGLSDDMLNYYDSNFIKNCLCLKNIESISKVNHFQNFVTGIDNKTLYDSINELYPLGIGLCISNDLFFDGKSDGVVYTKDQYLVDEYIGKSIRLKSSHHSVLGNPKSLKIVLEHVNDIIEKK